MKPSSRGILSGAIAVLLMITLSAAVASAQNGTQPIQSGNATMPIDVASSSPTQIDANYDTGNKITTYMQGQTNTNSADPQRKQPRQRPAPNNNNGAAPTEPAPSGNSTNPSGSGPANPTIPGGSNPVLLKELPKSGGATVPPLSIVGVLLVAGGLLVRKALR